MIISSHAVADFHTAQGRQENWPGNFPGKKMQGICKFCENTAKMQNSGVNSVILTIKDIGIFATNFVIFFLETEYFYQG